MSVIWWSNANANLWYEDYRGWMYSWAQDFIHRPVSKRPQVVSLSWGWNEQEQCQIALCNNSKAYVERTNVEFMKMAALGKKFSIPSPGKS